MCESKAIDKFTDELMDAIAEKYDIPKEILNVKFFNGYSRSKEVLDQYFKYMDGIREVFKDETR